MYYKQLDDVMAAIRMRNGESSFEELNKEKGKTTIGPYRIPVEQWDELATIAGIPGVPWYDRHAQTVVVRQQLTRLYNQYDGRWDVTAIAWEAGENVANRIAEGESIEQVVAGDGATQLSQYVAAVAPAGETEMPDMSAQAITGSPLPNASMRMDQPAPPKKSTTADDAIASVLTTLRDKQIARGGVASGTQEGEQGSGSLGTPEAPESTGV